MRFRQMAVVSGLALAMGAFVHPAIGREASVADDGAADDGDAVATDPGEIIVTARKRQESILKVPVIASVLGAATIENRQIVDIQSLAASVPGLKMGNSVLTIGTQISLRGVGTSSYDAGIDQSVSLNIDGLQLSQGLAYQAGLFDLARAEVLKGPQALFFGKSSPGGVIALTTADPGKAWEVVARASYEFEARERRGELIVSGPLTDTLGLRLAGMYAKEDGWFYNKATAAPGFGGLTPRYARINPSENYILRGTLVYEPSNEFRARLKANVTHDRADGGGSPQLAACPEGTTPAAPFNIPFANPNDSCKYDRTAYLVDLDPAAFPLALNGGVPFLQLDQRFGTFEMVANPSDTISVTSTTGYYHAKSTTAINSTSGGFAASGIYTENRFRRRELTQELRAESDFNRPLNFLAGIFYQDGKVFNRITAGGNTALGLPALLASGDHQLKIDSVSMFGQLRYKPVETLEIAGGARWTSERRSDLVRRLVGGIGGAYTPVAIPQPRISAKNWSPEVTVTYTPTDDFTVFAALKQGYKSGSYGITNPPGTPPIDNSFGDERVRGGELGVKSRLLDRSLSLNLAGYLYRYRGLQVGVTEPTDPTGPSGGLPVTRTINAGSAEVYGVDFDVSYRAQQIDDLSLNASVNWNHARFLKLENVPCYGGQTIANGCNITTIGTGSAPVQSLTGSPLVRAPEWQANFGFDYELPVSSGLRLAFGNNNEYSSRFLTGLGRRPELFQDAYFKVSGYVTIKDSDDRWEVSLIGNNLTNRITSGNRTPSNFAGSSLFGGQITGGTGAGPAGIDEILAFNEPGRTLFIKLTLRPLGLLN